VGAVDHLVLFGGLARNRSYPGSTMVTTFNAGDRPLGWLVTVAEFVDATDFLLTNAGVSAIDLVIDGGVRAS
jgi:hypothetical protein